MYVDNYNVNTVSVISGQTNTVLSNRIPVGTRPTGISFDSSNGNLYVTNRNDKTVSVISGRANTVVGNPIPVPGNPFGIAFDSSYGNLYVALGYDDTGVESNMVSVISGQTNTVVGSPILVPSARFIAFDSSNGNFYVTDEGSGTVSVISTIAAVTPPSHTIITSAVDGNNAPVQNGGTTFSKSITFTATAGTNPIAGFQCSLDNSPFSSCSSPAAFNNLAAGSHKFAVVAIDTKGNKDPNPATFSWNILTPAQAIQQLIQLKHSMHLDPATDQSLDIRLNVALQFAQNNIKSSTCVQLSVFIKQVQGELRAGHVTSVQATQLIQAAQNIQTALGCTVASSGNGIAPFDLILTSASMLLSEIY